MNHKLQQMSLRRGPYGYLKCEKSMSILCSDANPAGHLTLLPKPPIAGGRWLAATLPLKTPPPLSALWLLFSVLTAAV